MRTIAILLLASGALFAQSATFEVASVKVTQFSGGAGEGRGMRRGIKTTPGNVTIMNMPLKAIVIWAYGVKDYQVTGPEWTNNQTYEIVGKAAGPAKDAELQAMMQTLLTERFKLAIHREIKELPVYEMTIAKGGHRLKVSTSEGDPNMGSPKGGNGKMALAAERLSMARFADVLSQPLQRPVIDKTGLAGNFDFTLDLTNFIPLDAEGKPSPDKVAVEDRDTIVIMCVQQQLGLKLEPKKGPIEMIAIDSAEKVPSEN